MFSYVYYTYILITHIILYTLYICSCILYQYLHYFYIKGATLIISSRMYVTLLNHIEILNINKLSFLSSLSVGELSTPSKFLLYV